MLTPTEFKEEMQKIADDGHNPDSHIGGDNLLCSVLKDLGYSGGVQIFEDMEKWYE